MSAHTIGWRPWRHGLTAYGGLNPHILFVIAVCTWITSEERIYQHWSVYVSLLCHAPGKTFLSTDRAKTSWCCFRNAGISIWNIHKHTYFTKFMILRRGISEPLFQHTSIRVGSDRANALTFGFFIFDFWRKKSIFHMEISDRLWESRSALSLPKNKLWLYVNFIKTAENLSFCWREGRPYPNLPKNYLYPKRHARGRNDTAIK